MYRFVNDENYNTDDDKCKHIHLGKRCFKDKRYQKNNKLKQINKLHKMLAIPIIVYEWSPI